MPYTYETNGAAIYAESFATIRAEADLARFSSDDEGVVVRMIHAAGLVGLAVGFWSPDMVDVLSGGPLWSLSSDGWGPDLAELALESGDV